MAVPGEFRRGFRVWVVSRVGGYFRNPVRELGITCLACMTPVAAGQERCGTCAGHLRAMAAGLADQTGFLTWAVSGRQSGFTMRLYKAVPPNPEARAAVMAALYFALAFHRECVERLTGTPITYWASVPSLPPKAGPHSLQTLLRPVAPGEEVVLTAHDTTAPRALSLDHFTAPSLPAAAHVLLVEDTWTSGGHAQSAAAALHAAGAGQVSTLTIARWIDLGWPPSKEFHHHRTQADYDPDVCPWTGSWCPAA